MATLAAQIPQVLTAMKQANLRVPVSLPGIILTSSVIRSLGSLSDGLIEVVSSPDPNDPAPAVKTVTDKLHAYSAKLQVTQNSLALWYTAKVIQDAADNVHGTVNAASMLTALNALRNANTDGLIPPISMIAPVAKYPRVFNTQVQTYVLQAGKATKPGGWVDVKDQLAAAAG
jgi:hypothetical protein